MQIGRLDCGNSREKGKPRKASNILTAKEEKVCRRHWSILTRMLSCERPSTSLSNKRGTVRCKRWPVCCSSHTFVSLHKIRIEIEMFMEAGLQVKIHISSVNCGLNMPPSTRRLEPCPIVIFDEVCLRRPQAFPTCLASVKSLRIIVKHFLFVHARNEGSVMPWCPASWCVQ